MEKGARVYVAGGTTLIGAALLRQLERRGYARVLGGPGREVDLADAAEVDALFEREAPEYVFLAGGRSGGIGANQRYPAELIRDNLLAECHVIHSAHRLGTRKLLYLASSCAYPKHCPQPMPVESLFTGRLEPTSEAYAVAKLAGIALCQAYRQQYGADFIAAIPADAFGPGDDFSLEEAHVVPALIRRMHEAKERGEGHVEIWGTGSPRREFIFADDLADACIFLMGAYGGPEPVNIGGGAELSVRELALLLKDVVGFRGELRFDPTKPDGMPLKALDAGPLREMGWRPKTPLRAALSATYEWFLERQGGGRALREAAPSPGARG